jgi:purine catabolism regulator
MPGEEHVMITVQDLLNEALPSGSRVAAGHTGLDRDVTWATRLRAAPPAFEHLSGGELVLLPPRVLEELDERLTLADAVRQLATFNVAAVATMSAPSIRASEAADITGLPLIVLPRATQLGALERQTARFITERRRAIQHRGQEVTRKLMELAIAGESLDAQVGTLAQMIGRTIVVEGRDGQLITVHSPDDTRVEAQINTVLKYTHEAVQPWLRSVATTSAAEPATAVFNGRDPWKRIVAPVVGRDGLLGNLSLMVHGNNVGAAEQILTARGAAACAVTMARDQATAHARREIELNVLDEILDGALRSEVSLAQQLTRLGHDIDRPHVAIILRAVADEGVNRARARRWTMLEDGLRRAAVRQPAQVLWRVRGSTAEVVWPIDDPARVEETANMVHAEVRSLLDQQGVQESVSVGVGRVGRGFEGIRQSHLEARQALMLGRRIRGTGQVTLFDQLGVYRLIFAAEQLPEMRGFLDETLGLLIAYDREHGAELVKTLDAYFEANCSPKEASNLLQVHRNTVLYRLDRIAAIMQIDLNDPDTRLRLHLALHVRLALAA